MDDNRKHPRHKVQYHAALSIGNVAFCAQMVNISEHSAMLTTDAQLNGLLMEGKKACLIFSYYEPRSRILWANIVRTFRLGNEKTGFAVRFETGLQSVEAPV